MDAEAAIRARRTHKKYGSAPLDGETLRELIDLGRFAPNHKLTQPWRFRALGPEIRSRIDELAGEREAMKLRRAPTLVLATYLPWQPWTADTALLSGDPIVDEEDLHATACAVYAVLLGATNRGLASYWRTPACFTEEPVREALGLAANERLVALIHLGPAVSEPPPKERLALDSVLQFLP